MGAKIKATKRLSINAEYYPLFKGMKFEGATSPLSIGIDLETRGHVFQIFVGNSMAPNEHLALIRTTDKWLKGNLHIGFNLVRSFNLAGKK